MRLSKVINEAIRKASKGKGISSETATITKAVKSAVKAYRGTTKGVFEKHAQIKFESARGCVPLSVMDDETLLHIIKTEHLNIVQRTCEIADDENYSLNAELARAIATDSVLLGAVFNLENETEGNELL
jgi:hypothetical protein